MKAFIEIGIELDFLKREARQLETKINELLDRRGKLVCPFEIGDLVIFKKTTCFSFYGAHKREAKNYTPVKVKIIDITGHEIKPFYNLTTQYIKEDGTLDGRLKIYWNDVHKIERLQ